MITEYEVRVRRPWMGVKKGQVIKVNGRRKCQLVKTGMATVVIPEGIIDLGTVADPDGTKMGFTPLKKKTTRKRKV
jgi:hypothetical protein